MTTRYCSVCSSPFDVDEEGCEGLIGLVPFAFCATCRVGIWEWAQISFDLVPNPDDDCHHEGWQEHRHGAKCPDCGKEF